MRLFLVALQFLTRLPVRLARFEAAWLNDCVRHFPLVGALVGAAGAAVLIGAAQLWPGWVAAVLALTATVALTGGFHEDGLADTFDALGGVVPRDKALTIMKDSRIGSYGALALGLTLLLRAALLAVLAVRPTLGAVAALLASHAFGARGGGGRHGQPALWRRRRACQGQAAGPGGRTAQLPHRAGLVRVAAAGVGGQRRPSAAARWPPWGPQSSSRC